MHRTFAMLTAYNELIIDYFHYLLIWQQQLCIGKVYVVVVVVVFFFWGGGGGCGLGLFGCIVVSKVLTLPLGPGKEKHDPSQKIT